MKKAVLASKNPHKLAELQKILGGFGMEVVLESDVGVDVDVEETGTTFAENSFLKANAVMRATGLPAIADDSGLAVDALGGAPGVYSARYGGLDSDAARIAKYAGCTGRTAHSTVRVRHHVPDPGWPEDHRRRPLSGHDPA